MDAYGSWNSMLLEHCDKFGWKQSEIYSFDNIEQHLAKAVFTRPYHPIFTKVIVDVLENHERRVLFCNAILSQNIQPTNLFQQQLYVFVAAIQDVVRGPRIWDLQNYVVVIQNYVNATYQWCEHVKQYAAEQLLRKNLEYVVAAKKMDEYLQLEATDKIQAINRLKQAVDVFPEFAGSIGSFLQVYGELERQRADKQRKEMDSLREQVMGQVESMVEGGQLQAAMQIMGQLKQMFPEDLDVATLNLEVRLRII